MLWINFLHIYQPPTLEKESLVRVTKEAYLSLVKLLKENPNYKITLNITACLTEYLNQVGFTRLIDDLKQLIQRGQIELTGTAAFHPLLPLVPDKEIEKQIKINNQINQKYFGKLYQPQGFYLPEMAYADRVAKIIKQSGFKWIILDEIAYDGKINNRHLNYSKKYQIKRNGLQVLFRNRKYSQTFVPETVDRFLKNISVAPEVLITATDGELYGHQHIDYKQTHRKILKNKNLVTQTASGFLETLRDIEKINPLASSWESTPHELNSHQPYALWSNPKNKIHTQLWRLANFALKLNNNYYRDGNHFASRLHLEKGLASCTFWWASGRDFKMFNPPAWNPTEVEKGALELLRSVRSLNLLPATEKIRAEKMFLEIHKLIWTKHWLKKKNKQKLSSRPNKH